jgi:hypothetical protein
MITIKNATPHSLNVYAENSTHMIPDGRGGEALVIKSGATPLYTIPTSGHVARLATEDHGVVGETSDGTPIREAVFGALVGMPQAEDGVLWAIAMPCAASAIAAGRRDFVLMHDQVRGVTDAGSPGAVIGCLSFSRPPIA